MTVVMSDVFEEMRPTGRGGRQLSAGSLGNVPGRGDSVHTVPEVVKVSECLAKEETRVDSNESGNVHRLR